jgi:hypothetical protein
MTENNKPEWFEIADNDRPSVPRKASKSLPLAAVFAATLIIGIGAVVAQSQDEPPANATETTSTQSTMAPAAATNTSATPASSSVTNPAVKTVAKPAATSSGLQNPSIAKLPTKHGDDEGEGRGNHENNEDDND